MLRQNESRAFLGKYLSDPRVFWGQKRREMIAIAGIIPVDKWLAKIKQRSDVRCRLCKRAREQRCASTENFPEETYGHMNIVQTMLSAMEWRQLSRLPTTSSGDICMPACKLHKHQWVSSGLSHLIKRVVWARCGRRKSLSRHAAKFDVHNRLGICENYVNITETSEKDVQHGHTIPYTQCIHRALHSSFLQ